MQSDGRLPGSQLHQVACAEMDLRAAFLKCSEARKRGLLAPGEHCPKCPKKAGNCLYKIGLWRPAGMLRETPQQPADDAQPAATKSDASAAAPAERLRAPPVRFGMRGITPPVG